MWDPTRHPAGQQSRAKKSWKLSPFPLISHLWGLVSSCFVYMCWSSFVGSLLIFGNCFPPRTQHINPFNSSHPSSSIIIHAIHPFFGLHPYRPVQCDVRQRWQRDRGTLSCSSRCCSSSCLSTSRSSRRFFTWCGKKYTWGSNGELRG